MCQLRVPESYLLVGGDLMVYCMLVWPKELRLSVYDIAFVSSSSCHVTFGEYWCFPELCI